METRSLRPVDPTGAVSPYKECHETPSYPTNGGRRDVKRLNLVVQEFFARVVLEAVPKGVRIQPILG